MAHLQPKGRRFGTSRPTPPAKSGTIPLTQGQGLARDALLAYPAHMRLIALCLALAACVPAPAPADDTCNAAPYTALIGQPINALTAIPQGARVIRPGDAVTEDYSPTRLNIDLDDTGRILRAWCG
jgi:hypothetical protein